jgi:hypothetical protein
VTTTALSVTAPAPALGAVHVPVTEALSARLTCVMRAPLHAACDVASAGVIANLRALAPALPI